MSVQTFFERLIGRDASGRSWLPALLAASPRGRSRFGDLLDDPASLIAPITVRTAGGRLGCFEYSVVPPRELLAWFIDHPEAIAWPAHSECSAETTRLRRALLRDEPAGSQARAQERAHDLLATRSHLSREWWRFEDPIAPACVLITHRLAVTVEEFPGQTPAPESEWYPARTPLVRTLEAARSVADGRPWGSLLLSHEPVAAGNAEQLERALPASAPHLDEAAREELLDAYLGNLTWRAAHEAVGLRFEDERAAVAPSRADARRDIDVT